jgi:hypothetical protein
MPVEILQQYDGVVLSVDKESFWVRLFDKTSPEKPDEEGEILLKDYPKEEQDLIVPGAFFYWIIGYYESTNGKCCPHSSFHFMNWKTEKYDPADLADARKKAEELMERFKQIEKEEDS